MARTSSHNRSYFIALFFGSLLHVASAQSIQLKPCYRWDGSSSNNFPCNPEANVSACCGGGSICMTNIYCENPSGLLVVGECTDRSWNDPACPWRLNAYEYLMEDRIFSYKANTTTCNDGTLCPKTYPSTAENTTCCTAHQGKEEINYHNNERIPLNYNDLPYYYAKGGYTIPGYASTASASATSSPSAAGQSSATSSSLPLSTPAPTPQPASPGLSNGAKAGMGVGIALGAAILAALLAVLFLLRRRKRETKSNQVRKTEYAPPSYPNAFISGGERAKREMLSEVESTRPEMATHDPSYLRGELPTSTTRAEMDGSHNIHS